MLKIRINLTNEQATNHSQCKILYFILKDEKGDHWLLPLRPEVDIYKPKVVKGKIKPPEPQSVLVANLTIAKVYNIEDWLNDDSIDESIEYLMRSPRLNKMENQDITGGVDINLVLNSDTGKIVLDIKQDVNLPLDITSYGIHAVRTNTFMR